MILRSAVFSTRCAGLACVMALLVTSACGPDGEPDSPRGPSSPASHETASQGGSPELWFEDVAASSGLLFVHQSGHDTAFYMPEIMGGGAALFDADGDGKLDIYCVQSGGVLTEQARRPGNQLFMQRDVANGGGPDQPSGLLRFVDVSSGSGADHRGYGMGATAGDADNDGDIDLYVTNWGSNALLLNDGSGHFSDESVVSGSADSGWGTSSAFVDVDGDGDLDLFVVNYLDWSPGGELTCHNDLGLADWCSPQNYESAARDVLLANDGTGHFEDVSDLSGVASVPATGLGVGCGDFDGDGNVDIFVANDGMADALWMGDGAGAFVDKALLAGCAVDYSGKAKAGMGVALADVDDDADLDLIVCNLDRQSDSFFVNQGGWFEDRTPRVGLGRRSRPFTRFGMGLHDFDRDGLLDLFQANGRVATRANFPGSDPLGEPDLLQPGVAPGKEPAVFGEADTADGTANPPAHTGRAAAFGDLDNDGAMDIVVINKDGPARLLRNISGLAGSGGAEQSGAGTLPVNHWLVFRVIDAHGRDAYGATVSCSVGARTMTRDVRAAYSYLASNDPRVHFGLGAIAQEEATVTVTWVDGTLDHFGTRTLDGYHILRRGEGDVQR
ncbi:MAG: hypothetical protein ACI9EF_001742 [Pseudohongiellaceae bacterium]|jgi:hypothetical protein